MSLIQAMKNRRSVRTFEKKPVEESIVRQLKEYADKIDSPFGIDIEYVFLNVQEHGLSSPVLVGEPMYIAAKVKKVPCSDVAVGYGFEKLMLRAVELGLGTVWIGGTMDREKFEKAAGITAEERMPCITPLGWPAKKSFRETMMRKGVKADQRKETAELFFENDAVTPFRTDDSTINAALEAVRWAPSAVNKQPWRIIHKDGVFHFYEKPDKGYVSDAVGDMQKIDIGIALCHFTAYLEESGISTGIFIDDPGIAVPSDWEYIAGVRI